MSDATKTIWNQALGNAASTTFGTALGMIFGRSQDNRQLRQQRRLQDLQIMGEEQMLGIQNAKQLEQWKATGPVGQMEQYKKAGLNPALMYGMGGGGGQSMGAGTPSLTGAQAPQGGREVQDAIGMGMQMRLINAQTENIQADTKNKMAELPNKPLQGENIKASTASITQGIENQKAVQLLTQAETRVKNLDAELQGRTLEDQIETFNHEAKRASQIAQQAVNDTNVSDAVIQDKIKIIKAEAIGAFLRNTLTRAQTTKTGKETEKIGSEITLNEQAYEQNIQKLIIEWVNSGTKVQELHLQEMIHRGAFSDPGDETMKMIMGALNGIILFRTGTAGKATHTPIQGFKKY